jgi:hypothetical protein
MYGPSRIKTKYWMPCAAGVLVEDPRRSRRACPELAARYGSGPFAVVSGIRRHDNFRLGEEKELINGAPENDVSKPF